MSTILKPVPRRGHAKLDLVASPPLSAAKKNILAYDDDDDGDAATSPGAEADQNQPSTPDNKSSDSPSSESFLSGDENDNDGGKFKPHAGSDDEDAKIKKVASEKVKKSALRKRAAADTSHPNTPPAKRAKVDRQLPAVAPTKAAKSTAAAATTKAATTTARRSKPGSRAKQRYFELSNKWQRSAFIPQTTMLNLERLVYACNSALDADNDDEKADSDKRRLIITAPARALMREVLAQSIDMLVERVGESHRNNQALDRLSPMDVRNAIKSNSDLSAMDIELLLQRNTTAAPVINTIIAAMADTGGYGLDALSYEYTLDDRKLLERDDIASPEGDDEEDEDDEDAEEAFAGEDVEK